MKVNPQRQGLNIIHVGIVWVPRVDVCGVRPLAEVMGPGWVPRHRLGWGTSSGIDAVSCDASVLQV